MSWAKVRLVPEVEGIGEAKGGTDARRQPGKTGSIRGGCEQQSNKRTFAAGAANCRRKGPEERRARKGEEAVEATVHCIVLKVQESESSVWDFQRTLKTAQRKDEETREAVKRSLSKIGSVMFVYKGITRKTAYLLSESEDQGGSQGESQSGSQGISGS